MLLSLLRNDVCIGKEANQISQDGDLTNTCCSAQPLITVSITSLFHDNVMYKHLHLFTLLLNSVIIKTSPVKSHVLTLLKLIARGHLSGSIQ